jgi:hypothetical protein
MIVGWAFNPPPYWPQPPANWTPPTGWLPDPAWGAVPPGWQLWVPARRRPRPALLPLAGLGATLGLAVLATVVPRAADPQAPLAPGVTVLRQQRAAAGGPIAAGPASATPGATPSAASWAGATPTPTPTPTVIRLFHDCADLNQVYPNGVGMPDAIDRTTGRPVTNFGRSTTIYRLNLKHDRDGDGIACEPT